MEKIKDQLIADTGEEYEGVAFTRCQVTLSSNRYHNCTFSDCELVYTGHPNVDLTGCNLIGVRFVLDRQALNTVQFLIGIGQIQNGGAELVNQFLEGIRAGLVPSTDLVRPAGVMLQ